MEIEEFEKNIGIEFKNRELIKTVFTHRSYLNEHRSLSHDHNERLEFLGDAVLELCVTEYLFENYDKPEGIMTNWRSALVKGESLSREAKKLGMNELIKASRGESKNTGKARDLILANAFEALLGAIYLDKGYKEAYRFVETQIVYKLDEIIEKGLDYDAKSKFQELAQDTLGITPSYSELEAVGPDHNKEFTMAAFLDDKKVGEGKGRSKQKAQTEAATSALDNWDEIKGIKPQGKPWTPPLKSG